LARSEALRYVRRVWLPAASTNVVEKVMVAIRARCLVALIYKPRLLGEPWWERANGKGKREGQTGRANGKGIMLPS
jgi:hypothetical protein